MISRIEIAARSDRPILAIDAYRRAARAARRAARLLEIAEALSVATDPAEVDRLSKALLSEGTP